MPSPGDDVALGAWLGQKPRTWSVVIAARAALRAMPLVAEGDNRNVAILSILRAGAISRFAATHPQHELAAAAADVAAGSIAISSVGFADYAAYSVARAATAAAATTVTEAAQAAVAAVVAATDAIAFAGAGTTAIHDATTADLQHLNDLGRSIAQITIRPLWPNTPPRRIGASWDKFKRQLVQRGEHWKVWIDWYEGVLSGASRSGRWEAAFTDLNGKLSWRRAATANKMIAERLLELSQEANSTQIPEQSPAPVRVEERHGRIAKATDSDSALTADELDFVAWRDPVLDHINELAAGDFRAGTNHGRVRERLIALGTLLPGAIVDVKDRQFRIGYEIERFERLLRAYRTGGEDMPVLNAASLEDLDHLRLALRMGIDKLQRWVEFRRQSTESPAHEGEADGAEVGEAIDKMAAAMEKQPQYFDPELPKTFRFLAESARDPLGATRIVVYGAVKSAENLIAFLGQRALGVGKAAADATEKHISKAVATTLVVGLGGAAAQLSGALPQAWSWLKPLLDALSKTGGL